MKANDRYNPNSFNALHAGVAFLAFWTMNLGLSFLFAAFEKNGVRIEDEYAEMCLQLILMAAGLALIVLIMSLAARSNAINGGGFLVRKGCGTEILMAFVLIFGLCSLLMPLAQSFAENCDFIRFRGNIPNVDPQAQVDAEDVSYYPLLLIVLMPVLPAIFEELLFRGVILKGLLQFGKVPAVVLSALMFALAHGSYEQFIYQFIVGIVVGFLFVETKNIFVSMAAHFANNFFASWVLGINLLAAGEGANSAIYQAVVQVMFYLLGAVCIVAAFLYFGKRMLHMRSFPENARGDVAASFVVNDMVSGTLVERKAWYACGALLQKNAEPKFFVNKKGGRNSLNRKSGFLPAAIVLGIGLAIAVGFLVLSLVVV